MFSLIKKIIDDLDQATDASETGVLDSPIINIWAPDYSQGPSGVDQCPRKVFVSSVHDRLLMHRWGTRLLASDEPGTDPHGLSTPSQVFRETSSVVHGTGTDLFPLTSSTMAGMRIEAGMSPVFSFTDFESLRDVLVGRR